MRMRTFATVLVFLGFIGSVVGATEDVIRVELRDVQGLWGGSMVILKAKGELVVRAVDRPAAGQSGLQERRWRLAVDFPAVVAGLHLDAIKAYREKERPGAPDEAKPEIVIVYASGDSVAFSKWVGDKDAGFDAVYQALLVLAKGKGEKMEYAGPFRHLERD